MPQPFVPLGSVGLDAMRIAVLLRKNENVPVIFSGIDFCYRLGQTHFSGSAQSLVAQSTSTRLTGCSGFSRREDLFPTPSTGFFSDKTMVAYRDLFFDYFAGVKNVFDASFLENSPFPKISATKVQQFSRKTKVDDYPFTEKKFATTTEIERFFAKERENLRAMRENLSGKNLDEGISHLIRYDYLYLHFPDGHKISREENFIRRVKREISAFLEIMNF